MHVHLASLVEDLACAVAVAAAFCGLCAGAVTQRPYDFAVRNLLFQEGSCSTVGLGTCTAVRLCLLLAGYKLYMYR